MNYELIQNAVNHSRSTTACELLMSFPSMRRHLPSMGHQTVPFIHPYDKVKNLKILGLFIEKLEILFWRKQNLDLK